MTPPGVPYGAPMIQITYEGSDNDMARYLAFRAQDLWPDSTAFSLRRLDYYWPTDHHFPTIYQLYPQRHQVTRDVPPILQVSCLEGVATLLILNGGLVQGPQGTSVEALLGYLGGLPVWRVVRADNEIDGVAHVGT